MKRISAVLSIVAVGVLAVSFGCGEPTDSNGENNNDNGESESPFSAYFTYPQSGQPDTTIEDRLVELLDDTPEGEKIRGAFYTFSREDVADAFIRASQRGVDVQMVLGNTNVFDNGDRWSAVDRFDEGLGDGLTICSEWDPQQQDEPRGGCMGDNIHHNKFVTISGLEDGTQDVVLQTSSNITTAQLEQFNNMVMVREDAALYEAFVSYWEDLQRDEETPDYNRFERGDDATAAYFFPRSSGDPVLDALAQVDCEQGGDLYLAVAFFTDNRTEVATELKQMDQQGCNVHAITRERDRVGAPGDDVIDELSSGDIELAIFPEGDGTDYDIQLHSKYLAIDAEGGSLDEPVVWTGSHNYTWHALRDNDEVLLKVRDRGLFEAFRDDWERLHSEAEPLHP